MEKRKSQKYYIDTLRSFVEKAYTIKKKDEMPITWSPFVSRTSFSLERKVEATLKEEMSKSLILKERNALFSLRSHQFKSLLDAIRYETFKKQKKIYDLLHKPSKTLASPFFKKKFSFQISNKLNELNENLDKKYEEIERSKQISSEYQEMIRNLEISIKQKKKYITKMESLYSATLNEGKKNTLFKLDSNFKKKLIVYEVTHLDAKIKEKRKFFKESKFKILQEKAENQEIIKQKIKDLSYIYRKKENSANILTKTRLRIKNIDDELLKKKNSKPKPFEILSILDCLEILIENFQKPNLATFKSKIEDFDKKTLDNYYNNVDPGYFLARMFSFQDKYPDFNDKVNKIIQTFRIMELEQGTLFTRFQDLALQKGHYFQKLNTFSTELDHLCQDIQLGDSKKKSKKVFSRESEENEKIKRRQFLEEFKHDDSLSKEINEKIGNNIRFSMYCLFFLTESYFRLCDIIRNIGDKKIFHHDISPSLTKILSENSQFMQEKKHGLLILRQMNKKNLENSFDGKRSSNAIQIIKSNNYESFCPLKQRDLYELLLKFYPNEEEICQDICFFVKKYEILSFFLKLDQIKKILKEMHMQQETSFVNSFEVIKKLLNTAFQELSKELLNTLENYQNFIQKLKMKCDTLVLEILYYKPEFQIENLNKTNNITYFENENFKKAINNRISLYRQIYGIKKNKKSSQRINFSLNSAIQNFEEEEHEKENEEEEIFLEKIKDQIKQNYRKKPANTDHTENDFFAKKREKRRTLSFVIQGYKDLLINKEEVRKYEQEEILRQKKAVSFEGNAMP